MNNIASSSSSSYQGNSSLGDEYQNNVDNNVEMHRNSQMVMAENMALRPKNTNIAYSSKKEEFKVTEYAYIYS